MAIPHGSRYVVVPIMNGWDNLKIRYEDKNILIIGTNGKARDWFTEDLEDTILTSIEIHRGDFSTWSIFDYAFNENGEKLLILKRD